jgi:hypothetical protein
VWRIYTAMECIVIDSALYAPRFRGLEMLPAAKVKKLSKPNYHNQ